MMPNWLSNFTAGSNATRAGVVSEQFPLEGSLEYKNLQDLRAAWIDRYGYSASDADRTRELHKDGLNPFSDKSGIKAYERLLFAAADNDYTKEVVRSRTGSVESIFNPYIVPGYPMDIIDASPNRPSFHGVCASVTHSFSSRTISTSISFMSASTYSELSNYFIQPVHPWLQTALRMVNVERGDVSTDGSTTRQDQTTALTEDLKSNITKNFNDRRFFQKELADAEGEAARASEASTAYNLPANEKYDSNTGDVESVHQTLIGNDRARLAADQFYKSVFGVGAADPTDMYDFEQGTARALARQNGFWMAGSGGSVATANGGQGNDNYTGVGALRLVRRQIESRASIETKFGLKFIDLAPENYTGAPAVYENEVLTNSKLLEPGASPFLDYEEIRTFINRVNGET
jgi:hypothetical protein